MLVLLAVLLASCLLSSCRTHADTATSFVDSSSTHLVDERHSHDVTHDSVKIFVKVVERQMGDTVYRDSIYTDVRYIYISRIDTVFHVRVHEKTITKTKTKICYKTPTSAKIIILIISVLLMAILSAFILCCVSKESRKNLPKLLQIWKMLL